MKSFRRDYRPPFGGSVTAKGQGVDPCGDVAGPPPDPARANIYGGWKAFALDAPPYGRAAADAGQSHDLDAGQ